MALIVLGLDSSGAACSVAVLHIDGHGTPDGEQGPRVLARHFAARERGHAAALMPMIDAAITEAGIAYRDVGLYAVAVGPGSYTGVRIGLAAARGLALATATPVVGIATTRAVAHRIRRDHADLVARAETLAVAMDTKRADIYLQLFDGSLTELSAPLAIGPHEAAAMMAPGRVCVVGTAADSLAEALDADRVLRVAHDHGLPDAHDVAVLGAAAFDRHGKHPPPPPSPLYLRPPDVTLPGAKQRRG